MRDSEATAARVLTVPKAAATGTLSALAHPCAAEAPTRRRFLPSWEESKRSRSWRSELDNRKAGAYTM
ncbi:hypothetical protein [Lysinibacillus yapensis]|uniref:hypothetical protein n=1 Tax=Ureibacillus yapensis TaxID=2304605 RepID=UPI0011C3BC42|nr:hypothetical protein [Lysinibacillus yapensis]